MPGLTVKLHRRYREVLLKCSEFESDVALRAVFVTAELIPFRDSLSGAASKSGRVDACLAHLAEKHLSDGRPVLPLFLVALRDRYQEGDALRDELDEILEKTYPSVEKQPALADGSGQDVVEGIYLDLVHLATECLLMSKWAWLTDHAVRDLLPVGFVDGVHEFAVQVRKAIWPKKYPDLEKTLCNLADRANQYVNLFLEQSCLRGDWFRTSWRQDFQSQNERLEWTGRFLEWQERCIPLLFNLTVALNEFAQVVRDTVNPTYFLREGKFSIVDSIGVMSDSEGKVYFPTEYIEVDSRHDLDGPVIVEASRQSE